MGITTITAPRTKLLRKLDNDGVMTLNRIYKLINFFSYIMK